MNFTERFPRILTIAINVYFVLVVGYWLTLQLLALGMKNAPLSVASGLLALVCGFAACWVRSEWERNRTRDIVTAFDSLSRRRQLALLVLLEPSDVDRFNA